MNIVDRIIIDPITKGLKFLSRSGEATAVDDNHAFHVYHTTGQSGNASGSNPRVNFNATLFDTAGIWNGSNYNFKPKVKGIYMIFARALVYIESGQGQMEFADGGIFKNGSSLVLSGSMVRGPNTSGHLNQVGVTISGMIYHTNLSDYYETHYNSGLFSGSFGIDGSGTNPGNCFVSGFLLKRL